MGESICCIKGVRAMSASEWGEVVWEGWAYGERDLQKCGSVEEQVRDGGGGS
jgi:hypothetical protein